MTFAFNEKNLEQVKRAVEKYPEGRERSAVMELLWIAQKQNDNWLPESAIIHIAEYLKLPATRVYEIATFYSMYNLKPVGKYFIQACGTTPCMLMGAEEIISTIKDEIYKETNSSELFSFLEVECLGACSNGPMIQINDDYFEDLTPQLVREIIQNLKAGKPVKIGSQKNRKSAETQELL
jgi:NADH-quinone oxidoreductase subunit E